MKRNFSLLIFLMTINHVNAQPSEAHTFYVSGELNLGNYIGLEIDLNYLNNAMYSFKLGYCVNVREPKSLPHDYYGGLGEIFSFEPYDQLENYHFAIGKVYRMNDKGTIRANLSLGIGYAIIEKPQNWERIEGGILGGNYTYDYHRTNTVSLIINPKVEFPFTRFYGLTVSPMLIITKDSTYIGIGIGHMVGLLKRKIQTGN